MIVTLFYTNGWVIKKEFPNKEALEWFVHNEGDHLLDYKIRKNKPKDPG